MPSIRIVSWLSIVPTVSIVPIVTTALLTAPVFVLATAPHIGPHTGIAVVVLWLTGLGWAFHALLHRLLAAEDQLARLTAEIAFVNDAREAQQRNTQQCMLTLDTEWQRLGACLRNGEQAHVEDRMRALEGAILLLRDTT
ncbi:MAG: hypothetical protein M3Y65_22785 [Pseudomonadota bacterium]|nr:hypothetical protein [Pseudomonadota bacterium]